MSTTPATADSWYIRDAEGRIIGHRDACAYPGCQEKHEDGGVFCASHSEGARLHWAADRYGWGIPA